MWAQMSKPWGLAAEAVGDLVSRAQTMWQRSLETSPHLRDCGTLSGGGGGE